MDKPRIFLGSSGKQQELLEALTRGLEDVAQVDPWTTSFNPGTTTLERLVELADEVDFAAFASPTTIGRPPARPHRLPPHPVRLHRWSEAVKERKDPSGLFYYWRGERPRDPNAPQLEGTGELRLESADRAAGYFTTRVETRPKTNARTAGVYLRADPEDLRVLDGGDDVQRAALIAARIERWKSIANA